MTIFFENSCLLLDKNFKKLNDYSEIEIIIKGKGRQKILHESISSLPSTVIINNRQENYVNNNHEYNLLNDSNIIKII